MPDPHRGSSRARAVVTAPRETAVAATPRPLLRTWLGVVLISFSGVWVRLADVEAARSAFLRNAYALPPLLALLWWTRRRGGASPWLVGLAATAGLFLGIDLTAYHASIGIIGAGLGTVLPNLQIVFVGVAAMVVFRERPHGSFWAALPVVFAGAWLLAATGRAVSPGGSVPLGVLLGVVSGAFYSWFLIVLRMARLRRPAAGTVAILVSATLGGALSTGAVAAYEGVAAPAGWPADGWLLGLALGSQVVGWLLLTSSIHRLPAALTSVALLLQPLLAMVWGTVLLDEPIGAVQVGGAAVLLAGVVVAHRAVTLGQRGEPLPTGPVIE